MTKSAADQGDEKNTYQALGRINVGNAKQRAEEESSEDEGERMVESRKGAKTKR
jgi:hypothetical protein